MADFDPQAFLSGGDTDFDPAAFVGSTTSRSDAGSEYGLGFQKVGAPDEMPATSPNAEATPERTTYEEWAPGGEQVYHARLTPEQRRGVVSTERAESDAKNWARLLALAKGATFGAAPKISRASAKLQGLPDPTAEYAGAANEYPLQTALFQAIGAGPASAAIAPASAALNIGRAGAQVAPFAGKLLSAGATGIDAALQTGLQGLLSSDAVGAEGKAYDAASQAMLGGAAGAAMSLAPEAVSSAYQLAKQGAGKAAQVPRATLDKLYAMLGGKPAEPAPADDFAAKMAAAPAGAPNQSDVETKMTPIRNWLREGEYGGVGGKRPNNKDPDFLKKSGKLAKMLGQADEADTVVNASIDPGFRGPDIKHKGKYRGQQVKFPQEQPGWERQPHAWKAGDDDVPPGDVMDLFMAESEGPQTREAINALNAGERNASRWRNPVEVDSQIGRVQSATVESFPDPITFPGAADPNKTNAKGGAGSFYQPMGAGVEDEAAKRARFVAETNQEALRRFPQLADARPPTESEAVSWSAALERLRKRGLLENVETTGPRGTRVRTDVPAPQPTQAAPAPAAAAQQSTPWSLSEPYQPPKPDLGPDWHAAGKQRFENASALAGGASGAAAGFASPVYGGSIAGGALGYKAGQAWARGVDKGASKLAELGQKLLTDPAKLVQLEQQGGKLGSAAAFIMDGNRTGGESAMAARAFIVASQPWWREQFAQMDEASGY